MALCRWAGRRKRAQADHKEAIGGPTRRFKRKPAMRARRKVENMPGFSPERVGCLKPAQALPYKRNVRIKIRGLLCFYYYAEKMGIETIEIGKIPSIGRLSLDDESVWRISNASSPMNRALLVAKTVIISQHLLER
jgi:hypothetical protein